MKAKMISDTSYMALESRLNDFLSEVTANTWKLFDVKYDTFYQQGFELHSVLVLYGVEDAA
jgi:hypothetical protein